MEGTALSLGTARGMDCPVVRDCPWKGLPFRLRLPVEGTALSLGTARGRDCPAARDCPWKGLYAVQRGRYRNSNLSCPPGNQSLRTTSSLTTMHHGKVTVLPVCSVTTHTQRQVNPKGLSDRSTIQHPSHDARLDIQYI